jgi:hypothetical protein
MQIFRELRSATNKIYLTIYFDEKENLIYNNWCGYVTPENVKNGSLAVIEALKHFNTSAGLNNNQELVGRWNHTVDWIDKEWVPRAVKAGLHYYAHVVDPETFAASSAKDMLNRVNDQFTMKIFDNVPEARKWLQNCTKSISNI